MIRSLVVATILGGLTAFLRASISWDPFPARNASAHVSKRRRRFVRQRIPHHGVGNLPSPRWAASTGHDFRAEEGGADGPHAENAERTGDGFGAYSQGLIVQLLIQMASALLLTWLVLQTTGLSYARRIGFLAVAGLAAGSSPISPTGIGGVSRESTRL
jgi:hypothetical protein